MTTTRSQRKKKHYVVTSAHGSIPRVSKLTGAVMRPLSIITYSINITMIGVGCTLVNVLRNKKKIHRLVSNKYILLS